jgi:hypothetical protein
MSSVPPRRTARAGSPRTPSTDSIHALLHRESFTLFPDGLFADLFTDVGRRSVPPMIVAVVMVLQRLEGLSDREAVERFAFDVCWKYAAGGLGFSHTVLVDMRARLARSEHPERIFEAALLLATLLGQDLEEGTDGTFRIARRVAPERVISTVDADARHGHKTSTHRFDGYEGHVALDPGSEIVTATAVTPGNAGDAEVAPDLLAADLDGDESLTICGDAAYGSGELLETLEVAAAELRIKAQPPTAPGGRFAKDDFAIDTEAGTVTRPAGRVAPLRQVKGGTVATFGAACAACPLATRCTTAKAGRSISVGPHEASLVRARAARTDPAWLADYRATRPKVERRIAHLVRRRHGGRRARVRGRPKVAADFALLAAAVNLARLAVLGLVRSGPTWAARTG